MKIVSQLDGAGFLVGPAVADPSPLEPNVFLMPGGCVDVPPIEVQPGKRAKLVEGVFVLEDTPAPDSEPTLAPTTAQMWERIKGYREVQKSAGFAACGKWLHSDPESKLQHMGNKDTARDQLAAGGVTSDALLDPETGQQIVWKTMDGSWLPLTCQHAIDIVAAGKSAEFSRHKAAEVHKAQMLAAPDPAVYDFSGGWPAVFVPA